MLIGLSSLLNVSSFASRSREGGEMFGRCEPHSMLFSNVWKEFETSGLRYENRENVPDSDIFVPAPYAPPIFFFGF